MATTCPRFGHNSSPSYMACLKNENWLSSCLFTPSVFEDEENNCDALQLWYVSQVHSPMENHFVLCLFASMAAQIWLYQCLNSCLFCMVCQQNNETHHVKQVFVIVMHILGGFCGFQASFSFFRSSYCPHPLLC